MRCQRPKSLCSPAMRPILRQFRRWRRSPIKASAAKGNIRRQVRPQPATITPAQALAICPVPHRKQTLVCLRFSHDMIAIWSPCIRAGHGRYRIW